MRTTRRSITARPDTPSLSCDRIDRLVTLDRQVDGRVAEGPVQPAGVGHQLDAAAVGVEQPHGLVERALQDVARVADGGDACGDLAERALRLDSPLELLVQPRVAEHDGRLAGERAEELARRRGERVGPRRVGADGAERPRLADERRAHLGVIPVAGDPLVGAAWCAGRRSSPR